MFCSDVVVMAGFGLCAFTPIWLQSLMTTVLTDVSLLFCELIRECGVSNDNRPDFVVDNVIINGDWGYFDDYKLQDETDNDFICRNEAKALYLNQDERVICFAL